MTHEEALLIDIKFQLDMYGSGQGSAEDTLARVREIVSSPSLTDDQQVVLDWLKWVSKDNGEDAMDCIYRLVYGEAETSVSLAFIELDNKQQYQVLAAFAEWGSKSNE